MRSRTRTDYSILNISTGIAGYVLNTLLGFVCRIVFVRTLSIDYLGANGLFTNILTVLSLAELGVGNAITFALYKPLAEDDSDKIASIMRLFSRAYRIIGIGVFIIGIAFMPFLDTVIREKPDISDSLELLYFINLFNVASSYLFSYRGTLLVASQRNYVVAGINYIITIIQSVIQMIALIIFHNYLIYLLIQTAGIFIYNIIIFTICKRYFPYVAWKDAKPLEEEEKRSIFTNIRDLLIYRISGILVNSTDNILITFFKGLAVTGLASNYFLLTNTLNGILSQVFNGLTASVGNHNVTESRERQYELFSFLNMMNFWIFGFCGIGFFLCSNDVVKLCFGEQYELPLIIPFIMALNFFTVGMMNAIWTYKHTLGLFRYGRSIQFLTGVLNIALSVVLGRKWGLPGILAATLLSRAMTNLWYDPYAVYKYGFCRNPFEYARRYAGYLVILIIAALASRLSFRIIAGSPVLTLILKMAFITVITNGIMLLAFYRTPEFRRLKDLANKLMKRRRMQGRL
ncbi:MAG: hypothetical protein IKE52_00895 [Mogibacterium sp.]|nr:hypothetical protein [Mogibacterium sp.]